MQNQFLIFSFQRFCNPQNQISSLSQWRPSGTKEGNPLSYASASHDLSTINKGLTWFDFGNTWGVDQSNKTFSPAKHGYFANREDLNTNTTGIGFEPATQQNSNATNM